MLRMVKLRRINEIFQEFFTSQAIFFFGGVVFFFFCFLLLDFNSFLIMAFSGVFYKFLLGERWVSEGERFFTPQALLVRSLMHWGWDEVFWSSRHGKTCGVVWRLVLNSQFPLLEAETFR